MNKTKFVAIVLLCLPLSGISDVGVGAETNLLHGQNSASVENAIQQWKDEVKFTDRVKTALEIGTAYFVGGLKAVATEVGLIVGGDLVGFKSPEDILMEKVYEVRYYFLLRSADKEREIPVIENADWAGGLFIERIDNDAEQEFKIVEDVVPKAQAIDDDEAYSDDEEFDDPEEEEWVDVVSQPPPIATLSPAAPKPKDPESRPYNGADRKSYTPDNPKPKHDPVESPKPKRETIEKIKIVRLT